MANERLYPILPCRELDESIAFYELLGFRRTYRQVRPNPYAVVVLEHIHIHLAAIAGFNPADSYASVIIAVPDPENLYRSFAAGLRTAYGKLPVAGIPRILRPRKKYGTVSGFTLIDPGGNWLRVYQLGDTGKAATLEKTKGLAHILTVATRLGDARGDEQRALQTLESGIERFPEATAIERARAYMYRVELAFRLNKPEVAQISFTAAMALDLTDDEKAAIAEELAYTAELVQQTVAAGESVHPENAANRIQRNTGNI